ncbi:hypothetical protein CY652_02865 [Burkholderia sp. WAC0059]|uniref:hypothetical protein n=1 Tax=Burkholderia sp. WAC0059 TaxID=2066022 RepID=UPI000C7E9B86|nr:hypothetical protein CY652_02865 [Burkholderia sp. WAC0059]
MRRALADEDTAEADAGRGWLPELVEARRALKAALRRRDDAPAAEQQRIAAILVRAAEAIERDADGPAS